MSTEEIAPPRRIQVLAPRRPDHPGIRIAGYYWPTDPPTICELADSDADGPHKGNVRVIGRKTHAALMYAMETERRLTVIQDPGERAAADAALIARLGADLAAANAKIADLEVKYAEGIRPLLDLRAQSAADSQTIAIARGEAEAMRKRAIEAETKAEKATKVQAQSEAKAADLERRIAEMEKSRTAPQSQRRAG